MHGQDTGKQATHIARSYALFDCAAHMDECVSFWRLQHHDFAWQQALCLWSLICSTIHLFMKTTTFNGQPMPVSKSLAGMLIAGAAAGRRTATCAERPAAQDEPPGFLSRRQPSA